MPIAARPKIVLPKVGDIVNASKMPKPYCNDMKGDFEVVHVYEYLESYVVVDVKGNEYVVIS